MNKKLYAFLLTTLLCSILINGVVAAESLPWGVERIGGAIVWDKDGDLLVDPGTPTGNGIRVAVLDTGIDYSHPDLSGRVVDGNSFVDYTTDYMDDAGHGTAVAGVIAAIDNGDGVVGMAPRVSLIAVKVAHYDGYADPPDVAAGIRWSADPYGGNADIISISGGFDYSDPGLESACHYAHTQRGALLVAASGNNNTYGIDYPARYDLWVVAVGAIFQADPMDLNPPTRWVESPTEGSNYGPELDFVAPTKVNTTALGGSYTTLGGTSAAVPHVSGAAALVWSSKTENGPWDNIKAEQKMRDTALDLGSSGKDDYYGYGLVNAWYANQRPPADITYDLRVNLQDVAYLNAHWWNGVISGPLGYDRRADINIDNKADLYDAALINWNWGKVDP